MSETVPRDEMVDGAGRLRPHWRGLLDTLAGLGHDVLAERGDYVASLVAQDMAVLDGPVLRLTDAGKLLADHITLELFAE